MMKLLRKDVKDFQELEWHFNEDTLGLDGKESGANFNDAISQKSAKSVFSNNVSVIQSISSAPNSLFYNVQRLLIQEKGEDIYYAIA